MQKLGEAFKGRLEYAYHRTNESNIPLIVKNGFIPGSGDMYGKGWYMCYDLESQLRPSMTSYGDGVIKAQIFDKGVLIFDYNISKEMYGSKYTLVDQLVKQGIFANESVVPFFYKEMSRACEGSLSYPPRSAEIAYHCFVRGENPMQYLAGKSKKDYGWGEGNSCLNVKGVPRINKITAIVFSGNHDGNVVVGYSPNTVLPVSYAIIDSKVCRDYQSGNITLDDIEFTSLQDYTIAEERARQARELYERLGALRNSSIISLDLQYTKMTSSEFEDKFRWIARDSKVTNAEIVITKDNKFVFTGGSWDNGLWKGDVFGVKDGRAYEQQPKFKGGIFTTGEFLGEWEFGKFIGGTFNGLWKGRGSKGNGGIWSAPASCWGSDAILYNGSTIMYETKPGSGKYVESDLTPPNFYRSLEGPQVSFSSSKRILLEFDKTFTGNYTVPDGVEVIGDNSFSKCRLKSIVLPNSVKYIGRFAFKECLNLSKVQFGNGLLEIAECAFYRCKSLSSITLPTGLQEIYQGAFIDSGLSSIIIPDSVKSMGTQIFQECKNLSYVKLPSSLKSIPDYTFDACQRLFKVDIPDACQSIGEYAFRNCLKLRTIKLPSQLQEIGASAFALSGIQDIEIPKSVKLIKGAVFQGCDLKTLKLPKFVTTEQFTFSSASINTIIYDGTLSDWDKFKPTLYIYSGIKVKCTDGETTT